MARFPRLMSSCISQQALPKSLLQGLLLTLSACGAFSDASRNEIVLCPGSSLTIIDGADQLDISAPSILERRYRIKEADLKLHMTPRVRRWFGALGVYSPTGSGNVHAVVEEGYQYFSNEHEFSEWLSFRPEGRTYTYTKTGLMVGWSYKARPIGASGGPDAVLSVDIWG